MAIFYPPCRVRSAVMMIVMMVMMVMPCSLSSRCIPAAPTTSSSSTAPVVPSGQAELVQGARATSGTESIARGGWSDALLCEQSCRETACGWLAGHVSRQRHVTEANKVTQSNRNGQQITVIKKTIVITTNSSTDSIMTYSDYTLK